MRNGKRRNKKIIMYSLANVGTWLKDNMPLLPLLLLVLFAVSVILTRWMVVESKNGYVVNFTSPRTYYALYQVKYIDETATQKLRDMAADSVKGVVVERRDTIRKIRQNLEKLDNSDFIGVNLSPALQELINGLSNDEKNILSHSAFTIGQDVLFLEESDLADRDKLSSAIWDRLEQVSLSTSDRNILYQILEQVIEPVVSIDPVVTEEVRDSFRSRIDPVERVLLPGDVIVQKREIVTPALASVLRAQGYLESKLPMKQILLTILGTLLWVLWLNKLMVTAEYDPRRRNGWLYISCLTGIGWVSLYIFRMLGAESVGLVLLVGSAYLTLPQNLAFHVVLGASLFGAFLVSGFSAGNVVIVGLSGFGSAFMGYCLFRSITSRIQLWRLLFSLGVFITALEFSVRWGIGLPLYMHRLAYDLLFSGIGGLVTIALLPLFENIFDVISPLRLLELSNPSHPLLKKLQIEAPGTYQHSLMVGTLAEAAANAVGLDSGLLKTGAYYHDVGKLKRPHFFVENQRQGDNVHDRISPSLSALSIIAHVRDGADLAKAYNLPGRIIDFILEHHGKTCLLYFYRKAKQLGENVDREQFCYPGPLPASKETALLMLVDSVEAGVRADIRNISTPKDLEEIINSVIESKLAEGQLRNVDFTLKDMTKIREALLYTLQSMYHTRRVKNLHDEQEISEEGI